MDKTIRKIIAAAVLLLIVLAVYQWHLYTKKAELRSDALLYFKEEDYKKSIEYLEDALKKDSLFGGKLDRDMNSYLAESYYRLGDYEKAQKLYRKLQKEEPDQALYYLLEGECLKASEEYDDALQIFQKGWEQTKDTAFLSKICGIYIEQNEYEKALDYAQKGISDDGGSSSELMYQLIIIYERSQDYEKAYQAAQDYCEQYPEDDRAKRELIFLSSRV